MPILIPDLPNQPSTTPGAPEARLTAAAAPTEALGHVAKSIGSVGGAFQEHADQVQRIENARLESEARNSMAEGYAQLQLDMAKENDPAKRIEMGRAYFQQSKANLDNPDLPPAVRDSLRMHHDDFSTRGMIAIGRDAAALTEKRAGLALNNELATAIRSNDAPAAQSILDRGVAAGLILPEEAEAKKQQITGQLFYQQEQRWSAEFPLEAEKQFNSPEYAQNNTTLSPEQIESLRNQAEQKANRYRADFANDIIISGVMPSEKELEAMAAAGQISKAQHARWASRIRENATPQADPAIYEETYTQIMGYNPANDPSGRVEAEMRQWIASQPLPKEQIKALNDKFTDRLTPATAKQPKNVHESAFSKKIATDFNRGDWGKFRFPVDEDNNPDTAPTFPVNQAEYDKAWKLRGQFSDQWRGILSAMPEDASFEQVQSAYDALKTSFKDKRPMPDLSFAAPVASPFDPTAVYQATGPARTFGGQPIKPPGGVYAGASATVFGGKNDPVDNGQSALGGTTGAGGREGTAIPQKLLQDKFPGKDKAWIADNVRTVVRTPDGSMHTLSVADFGTAEWVWQRNGRPTLDLTEGAAKQLGGRVTYTRAGKLQSVQGLDHLDFAVVSTATAQPLDGLTWEQAKASWFQVNRPASNQQATLGLVALRDRWNRTNLKTAAKATTGDLSQNTFIPTE